ncbi:MAG: hypothetical protein M3409_00130 [Gemmatimonadota bacterium]|jgi:hypothetical protein|nr:hypothetical protein [Gemmatimonadota bacterium]
MPQSDDTNRSGSGGSAPKKGSGEDNQGAEFGASEPATAGTNRDADASGESKNQGHGHTDPRKE